MKTTVLFLLLVLAVSPVCAADIYPSNYSGCDSVGTGSGAGHEILEVVISGLEAMAEGNTYGATGGWSPYSFSSSCGSIDAETGVVGDISSCCGSGSVTVTDYADVTDSMDVRFPSGIWANGVQDYSLRFGPGTPLYLQCVEEQGTTLWYQGFFCTSGTLTAGATDSDGDSIPPIYLQCATDHCDLSGRNAVAWTLYHTSWVCN